ncbi:MAG: hypothetical protein PHH57_05820 [Candidatus Omnitrophica bacterium]|nr:hypothetical protein [Candidatus Omnitrophota bacterium]
MAIAVGILGLWFIALFGLLLVVFLLLSVATKIFSLFPPVKVPERITKPVRRLNTRVVGFIKRPLVLLITALRSLMIFIWRTTNKHKELASALAPILLGISLIGAYVLFTVIWFRVISPSFGEWPENHPQSFGFFIFILPITLFIAGIAVGGRHVKREKERELEELRSTWRSDRSEWKEYERKVEKEHEKNWVWDGKRQRWGKKNGFGEIVG